MIPPALPSPCIPISGDRAVLHEEAFCTHQPPVSRDWRSAMSSDHGIYARALFSEPSTAQWDFMVGHCCCSELWKRQQLPKAGPPSQQAQLGWKCHTHPPLQERSCSVSLLTLTDMQHVGDLRELSPLPLGALCRGDPFPPPRCFLSTPTDQSCAWRWKRQTWLMDTPATTALDRSGNTQMSCAKGSAVTAARRRAWGSLLALLRPFSLALTSGLCSAQHPLTSCHISFHLGGSASGCPRVPAISASGWTCGGSLSLPL